MGKISRKSAVPEVEVCVRRWWSAARQEESTISHAVPFLTCDTTFCICFCLQTCC